MRKGQLTSTSGTADFLLTELPCNLSIWHSLGFVYFLSGQLNQRFRCQGKKRERQEQQVPESSKRLSLPGPPLDQSPSEPHERERLPRHATRRKWVARRATACEYWSEADEVGTQRFTPPDCLLRMPASKSEASSEEQSMWVMLDCMTECQILANFDSLCLHSLKFLVCGAGCSSGEATCYQSPAAKVYL